MRLPNFMGYTKIGTELGGKGNRIKDRSFTQERFYEETFNCSREFSLFLNQCLDRPHNYFEYGNRFRLRAREGISKKIPHLWGMRDKLSSNWSI